MFKTPTIELCNELNDNDKTKRLFGLLVDAISAFSGGEPNNTKKDQIVSVLKKRINPPKSLEKVVQKHMDKIEKGDLLQNLKKFRDEIRSLV